jgi:hypothetical protein
MEEYKFRVFEDRVLRRIFGPKRKEVVGDWRSFMTCTRYRVITTVIKSKRARWARHVACMGGMIIAYNFLVRKTEGKKPCGRSRRRWEDTIRMDLREIW